MRGDKKTIRIFWTLFAFNALFYIPGATFGAYIGVYYRSRGMDVSQIGLLSAIGPLLALVKMCIRDRPLKESLKVAKAYPRFCRITFTAVW